MPLWNATLATRGSHGPYRLDGPGVLMDHTAWMGPGFSWTIPPGWSGGSHGPYRVGEPEGSRADREWWCAECVQNADRVRFTGLPNPPLGLLA